MFITGDYHWSLSRHLFGALTTETREPEASLEPMSFSAGLQLTGLDDYIAPSQACIKPVEMPKADTSRGVIAIELEDDGTYSELGGDGSRVKLAPAKITLNDCLACSGCITSAESVLITQQSVDELLSVLQHPAAPPAGASSSSSPPSKLQMVVSVAPQCWASLAAHLDLSGGEALGVISGLFRGLGAVAVLDLALAKDVSVIETCAHAEAVHRTQQAATRKTPVLASACPGWICYAEKREHKALPFISPVKSPQQIAGTLVKRLWARQRGLRPEEVYHVCIMPCYDKKLEASRPEFRVDEDTAAAREVDLVLSASELLELAGKVLPDLEQLKNVPRGAVETLSGEIRDPHTLATVPEWGTAGSSGGFAEYAFVHLARQVHNRAVVVCEAGAPVGVASTGGAGDVDMDDAECARGGGGHICRWKQGRNSDIHELVLEANADGGGKQVLVKVARCYGFRNIQNIAKQIKSIKGCGYDFVEVMACPSGCVNGGGLLRVPEGASETPKERLARVVELFRSGQRVRAPWENQQAVAVYDSFLQGPPNSPAAAAFLHTSYKAAEDPALVNPIGIQW